MILQCDTLRENLMSGTHIGNTKRPFYKVFKDRNHWRTINQNVLYLAIRTDFTITVMINFNKNFSVHKIYLFRHQIFMLLKYNYNIDEKELIKKMYFAFSNIYFLLYIHKNC